MIKYRGFYITKICVTVNQCWYEVIKYNSTYHHTKSYKQAKRFIDEYRRIWG